MSAVKNSLGNMVLCLGTVTLVCAALLAGIFILTEQPIKDAAIARNNAAIAAVTPAFASLAEASAPGGESYIIALGERGDTVAYVVKSSSVGFGGPVRLMVGFRPDGSIYNVSVLEHSETPGLGAKCTDEAFISQFKGFDPSVKSLSVSKDGGDVDAITASTITSRAFCKALEKASAVVASIMPVKEEPEIVFEEFEEVQLDMSEAKVNE